MLDLKVKKGAVTGGLSCGKSSVCRFFKEFGAYVVNADDIVHELLNPDTNLGQKILELLGPNILEKNNTFNRSKIASQVFQHPPLLKSLEKLLHPVVFEEIEKKYRKVEKEGNHKLFIAEIPILYEAKMEHLFDFVIAVIADSEVCLDRFINSTGNSKDEYKRRTDLQLSQTEKSQRADFVIVNNGTLDDMRTDVAAICNTLINKKS